MPQGRITPLGVAALCLFFGQSAAMGFHPVNIARQAIPSTENASPSSTQATDAGATTSIATATATIYNFGQKLCASLLEEITDAMPTEPPEYSSLSDSYYESHPRTADDPIFECGWIYEIPEDLDESFLKDENRTTEWFLGLDPDKDGELYEDAMSWFTCATEQGQPCEAEWTIYFSQVEERAESAGVLGKGVSGLGVSVSLLVVIGISVMGLF